MALMPSAMRSDSSDSVGEEMCWPLLHSSGRRRTVPAARSELRPTAARPGAASRSSGIGAATPLRNGRPSLDRGRKWQSRPWAGWRLAAGRSLVREKPRTEGSGRARWQRWRRNRAASLRRCRAGWRRCGWATCGRARGRARRSRWRQRPFRSGGRRGWRGGRAARATGRAGPASASSISMTRTGKSAGGRGWYALVEIEGDLARHLGGGRDARRAAASAG